MGRAAAVLGPIAGGDRARLAAGATLLAALAAYFALVERLPAAPTWVDVLLTSAALLPATFALVWLVVPLRDRTGFLAVALGLGVAAAAWHAAGLDVAANFAKLGAAAMLALWFLRYFEVASWIALVALLIPFVDAVSVWRGPTHEIVTEQPEVFDALSYGLPLPGNTSFALGLPDVVFFALFLGATVRFALRPVATWIAMLVSFGATLVVAVYADPFGIGGVPALPGISLAFLLVNADLLWRAFRRGTTISPNGSVPPTP